MLHLAVVDATPDDVPALAGAYNREIREGVALWNTAERSLAEMAEWAAARRTLVARIDGDFAGFGGFGPFRPHDGYAATVEHSLYVEPWARRRGVGAALLAALEAAARDAGKRVMIGGLEAENHASHALHTAAGFVEAARLPEVGRKFDRWLTLVLMHKRLA